MRNLLEGTKYRKIGLLGSAPSSLALAPWKDESYTFWGCSPGVYGIAQRTEAWFELHVWEPGQTWFSTDYCNFVRNHPGPVFVSAPNPEIKNATVFPLEEMAAKFGPYFWTSTVSYMLALAICCEPDEIGLWGVDMAATEEYGYQRAGCQYMAQIARMRGIKVTVPPQSDLFVPPPPYGFVEQTHLYLKLRERMKELNGRMERATAMAQQANNDALFIRGAIDDLTYIINTWPTYALPYIDPAGALTALAPPTAEDLTRMTKRGNGQDGEPSFGHAGRDHQPAGSPPA